MNTPVTASTARATDTRSPAVSPAPRPLRTRRALGFTLIELMVVVMILGVLAALVVPRFMSRPDEARAVAAKQDIAAIMQQLKLYRLDNGHYPSTEQGLAALVTKPTSGPAAKKLEILSGQGARRSLGQTVPVSEPRHPQRDRRVLLWGRWRGRWRGR